MTGDEKWSATRRRAVRMRRERWAGRGGGWIRPAAPSQTSATPARASSCGWRACRLEMTLPVLECGAGARHRPAYRALADRSLTTHATGCAKFMVYPIPKRFSTITAGSLLLK